MEEEVREVFLAVKVGKLWVTEYYPNTNTVDLGSKKAAKFFGDKDSVALADLTGGKVVRLAEVAA